MKKLLGYLLIIVSIPLFLLGLLFLIASGGASSRLIVGFVGIIAGSGLGFLGGIFIKTAFSLTPEQILNSILSLAKRNNGYLTKEAIIAELGNYPQVEKVIQSILIKQTAIVDYSTGRQTYVFPDFLHEIIVKMCVYCNSEYPLRDPIQKCTQCGGDIKLQKGKIEKRNEIFSLDDK